MMKPRAAARAAVTAMAFVAVMLTSVWTVQAQDDDGRVRGYVPPPTNLQFVNDHWTPYNPPVPAEGVQVHVVQPGDTLWDLAGAYYGDNYLWPVIWDANRYITYSHWIYPGDPLEIPPSPMVVTDSGVSGVPVVTPPVDSTPVAEAEPEPTPVPAGPALFAVAEEEEILCAAQLQQTFDPTPLTIHARETPDKELQATGDVVFLSAGRDMGIEAGNEYVIVRSGGVIAHPETGADQAVYVERLGRVRVLATQQDTSTAVITHSCDGIVVGDYLVPYREQPIPTMEKMSLTELAKPNPGRLNGHVVVAADPEATIAGTGDIIGIDLGSTAGLTAGDRILFWRHGEGRSPRYVKAHGVVLSSNAGGATVKLLEAREEVSVGDLAEAL